MKILVLAPDFLPNPGGVALFLHHICTQLACFGHRVDILTVGEGMPKAADHGQPYHVHRYANLRRFSSLSPLWRIIRLHCRNRYEVVFVGHFMTTHALGAWLLRRLAGVPYVILSHGNDLRYSVSTKADRYVARLLIDNAATMLGNSRFTADRIREMGYQGPVEVLNPGVDPVHFHPDVDTSAVRQEYGLDGRRVLLTTARLVARKNVAGVLRALPQVLAVVPNITYLIAGDGEEREHLESLCEELGLRHYVRFLGYVENSRLPALYCASDLVVMPSYEVKSTGDMETFGISFVEANACGKPVIGGRSGGTADAVIDGETGLLVDPNDVDAIARCILRLLTDRDLARRLGENGRRRVEREFSWQQVGRRLEAMLAEFTGQ